MAPLERMSACSWSQYPSTRSVICQLIGTTHALLSDTTYRLLAQLTNTDRPTFLLSIYGQQVIVFQCQVPVGLQSRRELQLLTCYYGAGAIVDVGSRAVRSIRHGVQISVRDVEAREALIPCSGEAEVVDGLVIWVEQGNCGDICEGRGLVCLRFLGRRYEEEVGRCY